jgi:hypothetical protein
MTEYIIYRGRLVTPIAKTVMQNEEARPPRLQYSRATGRGYGYQRPTAEQKAAKVLVAGPSIQGCEPTPMLKRYARLKPGKPPKRSTKPLRRSPIRKKAARKESWVVQNGIRYYRPYFAGREVCITDAAWQQRRQESLMHFEGVCQCGCGRRFGYTMNPSPTMWGWGADVEWDAHHVNGRGRGRDDRILVDGKPNLVPLLRDHHMKEHNQEWSKGKLQWQGKNRNTSV